MKSESAGQDALSVPPRGGRALRRENRIDVLFALPFVGWRGDMKKLMEYRPHDVSPSGMRLEIDQVDVAHGEVLDLCLPFLLGKNLLGAATVVRSEARPGGCECGVVLSHRPHAKYPVLFDFSSGAPVLAGADRHDPASLRAFLQRILKDAILTKRSMIVYFNHLVPLLARLMKVDRQTLDVLRHTGIRRTEENVGRNIAVLEDLETLAGVAESEEDRRRFLRRLGGAIRPEVDEFALRVLDQSPEIAHGLRSIRHAERKLALHYNSAVLLMEGFAHPGAPEPGRRQSDSRML